jgi:hypothetical protein
MAQVGLELHGCRLDLVNDLDAADNVCQDSGTDLVQGSWGRSDDVCRPAVDQLVKGPCSILSRESASSELWGTRA